MKIQLAITSCIAAMLFCGCAAKPNSKFIPVEGKYGDVAQANGFDEPTVSMGFYQNETNGTPKLDWPFLMQARGGHNLVVNKDTVVIIGGMSRHDPDGIDRLTGRLLAFDDSAGPALDITDDVLLRYYLPKQMGLTNFVDDSLLELVNTNDSLHIEFVSSRGTAGHADYIRTAFGSNVDVPWNEVEMIMADVRRNGALKRERASGREYLEIGR